MLQGNFSLLPDYVTWAHVGALMTNPTVANSGKLYVQGLGAGQSVEIIVTYLLP